MHAQLVILTTTGNTYTFNVAIDPAQRSTTIPDNVLQQPETSDSDRAVRHTHTHTSDPRRTS